MTTSTVFAIFSLFFGIDTPNWHGYNRRFKSARTGHSLALWQPEFRQKPPGQDSNLQPPHLTGGRSTV